MGMYRLYSHGLHGDMPSTMGPLGQIDENLFTSSPSLRRLSTSSMGSTISCATDPSSPAPLTPKSEDGSPMGLDENTFREDLMMKFQGRKSYYGHSIAPNLLSINSHRGDHDANSLYASAHEELLQPHQLEHLDQVLTQQSQPQCGQPPVLQCQDSMASFMDCSQQFSWGPETSPSAAAMTALQCTRLSEEYEEDFDISGEDSHYSSPPRVSSYKPPPRRKQLSSPRTPGQSRRAPRRANASEELIVPADKDKPHRCATCGSGFKRQEHLRRHEWTHTSERPYSCNAEDCGKHFSRRDNLRAHSKTHMKQGGRNKYIPGFQLQAL